MSVSIIDGAYRHQIMICCSIYGRQKAKFANGEHSYFAYFRVVNSKGEWSRQGAHIVPVLPDGRLLMVVEQRPVLGCFNDCSSRLYVGDKIINLERFGPHSSVEFPGGGVEPGENVKIGALRELMEETGIKEQKVFLFRRIPPCYQFGSDFAGRNFFAVAELSDKRYAEYVKNDGGLNIIALSEQDVENNIRSGVITSGQAALAPWSFYKEVATAKRNNETLSRDYFSVEYVDLKVN